MSLRSLAGSSTSAEPWPLVRIDRGQNGGMVAVYCLNCGSVLASHVASTPVPQIVDGEEPVQSGEWAVDPDARTVHVWELGMREGETKSVETDPPGSIVVHPADLLPHALVEVPGRSGGCCGLDGCDGPNQACSLCGAIVATARTDCWTEKEVRFLPGSAACR